MSTTLELPDDVLRAVNERATQTGQRFGDVIVGLLKRGLSIETQDGNLEEAMLQRRREITQEFVSGLLGVELVGIEEARAADRREAAERANLEQ